MAKFTFLGNQLITILGNKEEYQQQRRNTEQFLEVRSVDPGKYEEAAA
jgi:hypothetical protein